MALRYVAQTSATLLYEQSAMHSSHKDGIVGRGGWGESGWEEVGGEE